MNDNNHYYKKENGFVAYCGSVMISITLFMIFSMPIIISTVMGAPMILLVFKL
jgi:hypothetical protein